MLTVKDALLNKFIGRGTVREIVTQTILHTSVSPRGDVGVVQYVCSVSAPEAHAQRAATGWEA